MSKQKTCICVVTGREMPRRKSKLVKNHRVDPQVYHIASGLLIDGVEVFVQRWVESQSSRSRLQALIYACAIIDSTRELFDFEPTLFVTELVRECELSGKPLNPIFTMKLLEYIDGNLSHELQTPIAQQALKQGTQAFKESIYQ